MHYNKFTTAFLFPLLLLLNTIGYINAQNLITSPECVVYDAANKRYLVSCFHAGKVAEIDSNGNQSYFVEGLPYAYGNTIYDGVFYISTGKTIKGFDLQTAAEVMSIYIAFSQQMDGMTTDTSGNLYIADYHSGPSDQIIKINLTTRVYSVFVGPGIGLADGPQDLAYDKENNRLIVASFYSGSPIQAVSLVDSSVTNVVPSSIGNFDGVAQDNDGNYYFTSWGTHAVHKYDKNFANPPVVVLSGFSGPSNLCYNEVENKLAIPDFNRDTVIFYQIEPIGAKGNSSVITDFVLYQNYPNPFNPVTKIKFSLPFPSKGGITDVQLVIYDVLGRKVTSLIPPLRGGQEELGIYEVEWDASNYPSGVYFYRLESYNFSDTKKMVLVK
jgi:hypothetical protein